MALDGKIEVVARKGAAEKARDGDYYQKGIKVGGTWYNVCAASESDLPELNRGDYVKADPDDKNRIGASTIKIEKGKTGYGI